MSTLRETCCCGAEIEASDRNSDTGYGLHRRGEEFRAAHAVCREARADDVAELERRVRVTASALRRHADKVPVEVAATLLAVLDPDGRPCLLCGHQPDTANHVYGCPPPADDTRTSAQQRTTPTTPETT